ncbi:MAG: hypothetical protein M3Y04_02315, partial [Actinomycetota bacterium]|nr:hypothetical protein [Actinomycetota bacterium]
STKAGLAAADIHPEGDLARARRVLHHLADRRPAPYYRSANLRRQLPDPLALLGRDGLGIGAVGGRRPLPPRPRPAVTVNGWINRTTSAGPPRPG